MRRMSFRALALIAFAAFLIAAAGCGGGAKKSAGTTGAAPATGPATTAAATTGGAATAPALSEIASAANCRELADLSTKFSEAAGGATDSGDLKKVAQLLREFAAKTPSDIRPDFKVFADAYTKIAEAFGNVKPGTVPDAATMAKLQKLSTEIDSAKLAQASQKVSVWLQKNCTP